LSIPLGQGWTNLAIRKRKDGGTQNDRINNR